MEAKRSGWLRRRWKWLVASAALAVGLYAAAGYWLAPPVARHLATDYFAGRHDARLSLGRVGVDPFRLRLEIEDARVDAATGAPLLAAERLFFDLDLSSLWHWAWVFSQVELDAPVAHAELRADGSLNLADLLPPDFDFFAPLPDLRIARLDVRDGQIAFVDSVRPGQPQVQLLPVAFQLQDFHSGSDGGGFRLEAATARDERFDIEGKLSAAPWASQGTVRIQGLQLASAQAFVAGLLPFEVVAGQADLAVGYRIALASGEPLRLEAEVPRIDVRDLAVRAHAVEESWVQVPEAVVERVHASLADRVLAVGSVRATGARLQAWREPDGSLNVARLLAMPEAAAQQLAGWRLSLDEFALEQGRLSLQDRMLQPAAEFELDSLAVGLRGLDGDLQRPLPVTVDARVNGAAPLRLQGTVVPAALAADLEVELGALPLQAIGAYLPTHPGLRIRTGDVAGQGRLVLRAGGNDPPVLEFDGSGSLSGLEIAETSPARPLLSWQRVEASGLRYRLSPGSVAVARLVVHQPYARVVIDADGNVNLLRLLGISTSELLAIGGRDRTGTPRRVAREKKADLGRLAGMQLLAERVDLVGGRLSFADYSIQPNFRANVEGLRGSIRGLSSQRNSVARIDLAGHVVNRHSPVRITGESTVLAFDRHTDLRMSFRNIQLPVLNPYAGRYAGFAIDKGALTTELHYRIDDRALVADHHVVVDQLEWGEATDSKDKVSLPVRLGTALLKDRHGVIDLELPVTGSLDEPEFRLGPLVWQVLKNLVVKVVASPFSALAKSFAGAEQAQFVDFVPGTVDLPDASRQGLQALAGSLAEKPELSVEIPGAPAAEPDAEALADARLRAALATGTAVDYDALSSEARYDLLSDLYRREYGARPEFPAEVDAAAEPQDSWGERRRGREAARVAWLESRLRDRFQASPADLRALGLQRAEAVQKALLADGALDPARVFVVTDRGATAHEGRMRMELALQ